jgi:hypothetical protein
MYWQLINIALNMRLYEQSVQHKYRCELYEKFCKKKTELYECKFYTDVTQIIMLKIELHNLHFCNN